MGRRRGVFIPTIILSVAVLHAVASSPGQSQARTEDLKAWVTYLASDELQGRANFSSGLGLAAAFIQDHLKEWGVQPAGDSGSYLQTVRILNVRSTSRSSVTVRVGNDSKTFRDGEGITFPKNAGGRQRLTLERVEFIGYGVDLPPAAGPELRDGRLTGAAVLWLGERGPDKVNDQLLRRVLPGRSRHLADDLGAAAVIGVSPPASIASGWGPPGAAYDFVTAGRLDEPMAPAIGGSDEFFTFLFKNAPTKYAELKRLAENRDTLPSFRLDGVSISFNVDVRYEVAKTELTYNVVGIVEGTDPNLKSSYVAFGAHYDHVGYGPADDNAPLYGRVTSGAEADHVWNGADDDASGTAGVMALARAFATGERPRRSLLFVWHAGEELGTFGSRYFSEHPTVPIDQVVAQLNLDMIGRNRDDKTSEANTVYLVGSDRISSELHEISREANAAFNPPLTLSYELNDPMDLEQLYYRSDHYNYALKGIPVIFFTTGLHPDYHANTDEVSKILFDKMTRVTDLVYETGLRLANLDHVPVRDRRGPRAGKGTP